ncbi:hypothetical protein MWU38_08555 [Qipengyuania sp. S6317L1]|nr:hypothetical protein [Qipengyuania sp. S6317L1]MCK0099431.1 hypothetical protein [Qipengyuania sp. S6317L1]
MIATWQAPCSGDTTSQELLVSFDRGRDRRMLVLPALFDEANKMRRFTVQVMRALDDLGVDSFLPDLPGCNESLVPLDNLSLEDLRVAASAAAEAFGATEVLTIRTGALLAPPSLPTWQYAPQTGAKLLRSMLRARLIASREAGRAETQEQLLEEGRKSGLMLAGWPIGAAMFQELETAVPSASATQHVIAQSQVGGGGLWLRAEPSHDQTQADALAQIIAANDRVDT